jgi:PAS domain S-box-containing protein
MFTELFELLAAAVTVRDPGGELVYANRAALAHLGFESLEELRGRSSQSIMDDYVVEDENGLPLTMDDVPSMRLLNNQRAEPVLMCVINRTTGETRWNLLKATALRDRRGRFNGALTVIEDVTAVKTAEVRTRVLAESGRILASSLDYQQTLSNVVEIAVPSLADYCSVDLLGERGQLERVAAAHRDPAREAVITRLREFESHMLGEQHPASRVLLTGTSELYQQIADEQLVEVSRDEEHLALLRELGLRSIMIVPLRVPARAIGLITLATDTSRRELHGDDVELAEQLGRRAAVAVENSRMHTKLQIVAETLQQSLLPGDIPEVPGWEIASLYRPAETEQRIEVGGDFYEFFEHDGTWFAIVGDVAGKGVMAASVTALMRHGARVACRSEPEPAAILGVLDELLAQQSGDVLCTAVCFCMHPDHIVISSAGHPPAIVVGVDGKLREGPTPGPLLGAFDDSEWHEETIPVAAGELILVYTDGVTELPGSDDRFGTDRLRSLLAQHAGASPQALLDRLDAELATFAPGPGPDDIAVIGLRLGGRG